MLSLTRLLGLNRLLVSVAACVALSGCSDNQARQDIARLERSLSDIRGFQAEQTSKISSVETSMRGLSGRVDELEFQQNQRLGSALNTIKSDLTQLRRRVPPPAVVPAPELESDENALANLPPALATPLGEAFGALREGNFERASQLLEDAMGLALDTDYVPEVLFWRAVAFEGAGNFRGALENYVELVSKNPRYERSPLAMFRQAGVLIALGDKRTARVVFTKLINDHPKSSEAQRARERLKSL